MDKTLGFQDVFLSKGEVNAGVYCKKVEGPEVSDVHFEELVGVVPR